MGCGVTLKFLIFILSMNLSIGRAAERDQEMAYVADPVGNPLSKPTKAPAKVGSPIHLIRPDRYEFYTFDETGELIKRLMTLEEIQEIIATGDGDDGHMLTVAQADSSKPPVTFNFQPPTHVKVHTIVNSVQNVLKAEMEAQKTNPPKPAIFDTPDVSSSWSMILPAIFGNTGGSISPDSIISSHVEPETDVINVPNNLDPEEEMFDDVEDDYASTLAPMHRESDDRTVKPDIKTEKTTYIPIYDKISITSATPVEIKSATKSSVDESSKITQEYSTSKPTIETKTEKINPTTVKYVPISHLSGTSSSTEKIVTKITSPITEKITENHVKVTSESVTKATTTTTKAATTTKSSISEKTTASENATPSTTKMTTTPRIETTTKDKIELIKQTSKTPTTLEEKPITTTRQPSTSTTMSSIRQKPQVNKVNDNSFDKNNPKPINDNNNKLGELKKSNESVVIPVKESSTSTIPIMDINDIIHKIAMDLNDEGPIEQLVSSTVSEKQTTTTSKPTTIITTSQAAVTVKSIPPQKTTEKIILQPAESTTHKMYSTIENLISTQEPLTTKQTEFVKIDSFNKNKTPIESKSTEEPDSTTKEIDILNDDDYLERNNPTTLGYIDVTKPDLHELSGSITDLLSQIAESRPTHKSTTIKENFYTPTSTTIKSAASVYSTTQKITTPDQTPDSSKTETKQNNGVITDHSTKKPSDVSSEKENPDNSTLLIIVEDLNDSAQNDTIESPVTTFDDIIPTTYRPVPLFFRSTTTAPTTKNYVQISDSTPSSVLKPVEHANNTYEKLENVNKTSHSQVTETLTTIPPTEDEFDIDVELVTSDTFIDDYETTTDNTIQDDELMDMINQVSQLFQSNSPSKIRNDDETLSNEKKTSYKKTDVTVEDTQSTTERKKYVNNESATISHIKIDLIVPNQAENVSHSINTERKEEKDKNKISSQNTIVVLKEENKSKEEIYQNRNASNSTTTELPNKKVYQHEKIATNTQHDIFRLGTDLIKNQKIEINKNVTKTNLKEKVEFAPKIELTDLENTTKINDKRKVGSETDKNENKLEATSKNEQTTSITKSTPIISSIYDTKQNEMLQTTTQFYVSDEQKVQTEKIISGETTASPNNLKHTTTTKTTTETVSNIRLENISPVNAIEMRNNYNNLNKNDTWKLIPNVGSSNITDEVTTAKVESTTSKLATGNYFSKPTSIINQNIHRTPLPNIDESDSIETSPQGLEKTTVNLGQDVLQFSHLCNELAFKYWESVSSNGADIKRSLVVSPFAVTSILAMMFLGARGATSGEMNDILKLDEMVTFNPHIVFKNVTESIEISKKSGVATSAFVRELYSDKSKGRLLSFYKDRVQQFYGGHVEEINYNSVGDIVRRRTNLLVKRQTWGKIPEYIKGNNMVMRPPLSVFSANVFQTDCSGASTDGRNGEMYFVVSPTIRQRRLIPVPAVLYKDGFLAGYVPELDATIAAISGGEQVISTILVMPGQQGSTAHGDDIIDLQKRIIETSFKDKTWNKLLRSLSPRPGLELQIPRFSHRSVENGSLALQKMGLKDLFTPEKADLRGLNGQSNDLYLSDMTLVNTFTTCGEGYVAEQHHIEVYPGEPNKAQRRLWRTPHRPVIQDIVDPPIMTELLEEPRDYQRAFHDPLHDNSYLSMPLHLRPRQARLPEISQEAPKLKFDRPFMFFVRHNPTGLILHMGRYNPRLLP